jgi:hypothetical protein
VSGQLYPPYPPVDHPAAVAKLFVEVDVLGGVRQPLVLPFPIAFTRREVEFNVCVEA